MAGGVRAALTATSFELAISDQPMAVFSELRGITSAVELPDFILSPASGTMAVTGTSRQRPPSVVLRRRLTPSIELAAWHELVILGDVAAASRPCTLTMRNAKGETVARYALTDAWPCTIEVGALDSGILMETVTMTCRFLQRISV